MKTIEQILTFKGSALDGRDIYRLANYLPVEHWAQFGLTVKEGVDPATIKPKPLIREEVLENLKGDVAFGFEKALNKRGLSAGMMYGVVKMWLWVLDDELADFEDDDYAEYGLPLLKAVAVKYGFPNEIGDDNGDEYKYSSEADY